MKKLFFFAIIAAAFSFAACSSEETTDEQPAQDSVVVAEPAPVDTTVADEPAVTEPEEAAKPAAKKAAKEEAAEETQTAEKTKPKKGGTQGKVTPGTTTQKESIGDTKAHLDQKAAAKKEITGSGKKAAATTGTAKQGLSKPE